MPGTPAVLFLSLSLASLILGLLFIYSFFRYRKHNYKEDFYSAITMIVIAMIIISMNIIYVHPAGGLNSVRYIAQIYSNDTTTVILPVPEESVLIDNLEIVEGNCDMKLTDTEYGKGLEITLDSYVRIEGIYPSSIRKVDHNPDLLIDNKFKVYFESNTDNNSCTIQFFRIIHQSLSDFHSKQFFFEELQPGWNTIEYQYYSP